MIMPEKSRLQRPAINALITLRIVTNKPEFEAKNCLGEVSKVELKPGDILLVENIPVCVLKKYNINNGSQAFITSAFEPNFGSIFSTNLVPWSVLAGLGGSSSIRLVEDSTVNNILVYCSS